MTFQIVASLMIVILTTLEVSFMLLDSSITLLENIYSTGVTHDDCHLRSSYFYDTGPSCKYGSNIGGRFCRFNLKT